jgi:hypothetical protein
MGDLDLDLAADTFAHATDGTVGLEEEFATPPPSTRCWARASAAS